MKFQSSLNPLIHQILMLTVFAFLSGCASVSLHEDLGAAVATSSLVSGGVISRQDAERITMESMRWGDGFRTQVKGTYDKLAQMPPPELGNYAFLLQPHPNADWRIVWGASQGLDVFKMQTYPYRFDAPTGPREAILLEFTYNSPSLAYGGAKGETQSQYSDIKFILRLDQQTRRFVAHRSYTSIFLSTTMWSQRERMQRAINSVYVQTEDKNGALVLRSLDGKDILSILNLSDKAIRVAIPEGRLKSMRIPDMQKMDLAGLQELHADLQNIKDGQWQKQKAANDAKKQRDNQSSAFLAGLSSALQSANKMQAEQTAQSQSQLDTTIRQAKSQPTRSSAVMVSETTNGKAVDPSAPKGPWALYMRCAYIYTKSGPGGTESAVQSGSTIYLSQVATFQVSNSSFSAHERETVHNNFVADMRKYVPNATRGHELCETSVKSVGDLAGWSPTGRSSHRRTEINITPRQ